MEIRQVGEVIEKHHDFQPGWKYREGVLANPRFARVEHVVVLEDGRVLWDQVRFVENPGVVVVPYTPDFDVVLVRARRPVAGVDASLEFPRGFCRPGEPWDEAAVREVEEETGLKLLAITKLGNVNPNTAFYASEVTVCAALVEFSGEAVPDGVEVRGIEVIPLENFLVLVGSGSVVCGLTLAAAMLFLSKIVKPGFRVELDDCGVK